MNAEMHAQLFQPIAIGDVTLKNRIVISPMCQHAADFGHVGDWHVAHLGRFAIGGAGLVFVESTAVDPRARIGIRDVGLWSDTHVDPLRRVAAFLQACGAKAGVQLAHAGRKAGSEALWEGGRALTEDQFAETGEPWLRMGPSAVSAGPGWSVPHAMSKEDIAEAVRVFAAAATRADQGGFDVVELHFGHGYLAASFLSPVSNKRDDEYGGDLAGRMRLPLEIAAAVRAVWPKPKPLFVRISAEDGAVGGWNLDDSVALALALKEVGVDVIDCSSGGLGEETRVANIPRGLGFQVPYAERIRREAGVMTQAVGVILDGAQAEDIVAKGRADLVAIGREALLEPNWAVRAARELGADEAFETLHFRHAAWLAKREPLIKTIRAQRRA
jgi:2,4-dienoyl-CoA reductase-like NADH-dependent reductase (Old Yellow Enzyme family)